MANVSATIAGSFDKSQRFARVSSGRESSARVSALTLTADDGQRLAARLYEPGLGTATLGTVVINSATATPQPYYRRYAAFLAEAGLRVLTYDYRGIGGSRPTSLRGFDASMSDWAEHDAKAAFEHIARSYPGAPVAFVGHSFGGQLLALLEPAGDVRGGVLVGAQLGYLGHWPARDRLKLALFWYGLTPALTSLFGYMPARAGLGEDLPAGVARQWSRWCRDPEYLFARNPAARRRFERFQRPLLFYSFSDDAFAPEQAVRAFLERAKNPNLVHRRFDPGALGARSIGHFGFFRSRFAASLWQESRRYLCDLLAGEAPSVEAFPAPKPELWRFDFRSDVLVDLEFGRD